MKKILVISTSGDGIHTNAFTNLKAVFDELNSGEFAQCFDKQTVDGDKKYNYENLRRGLKEAYSVTIHCADQQYISITEVSLHTKPISK